MNIAINTNINNITFNGKYIKTVTESINNDILTILHRGGDFNELASTGLSFPTLLKWFRENMGISAAEYFKQKKLITLKKEFLELHQQGFSIKEIAQHFKRSYKWAYNKFAEYGILSSREELREKMNKNMLNSIRNGDTFETIAKEMNCSPNTASKWVQNNLKDRITKYRHDNDIILFGKNKEKLLTIKNTMEKYFSEGKNLSEVGKLMEIPISQVYKYKKIFNLKTKTDLAHDFMEKYLPDMIKADWSIKKIADVTGLSDTTIGREYKKLTGFSYRELHNII